MKKLLFFLLVLPAVSLWGQDYIWGAKNGSPQHESAYDVEIDGDGNRIIVGEFSGATDFDPSGASATLTPNGQFDAFIQKLDANGNYVWAISFGGTANERIEAVTIDGNNDIYVIGYFSSTCDFDPGLGTKIEATNGSSDIFISKFDSNGNLLWNHTFGSISVEIPYDIHTNGQGNIVATGYFTQTVDFDPDPVDTYEITYAGVRDVFVVNFTDDGDFNWVSAFSGTDSERGRSVFINPSNEVLACGHFQGTVDFDPGAGTNNITSQGADDIFIAKLDASGNLDWVKTVGTSVGDLAKTCAEDSDGNVLIGGEFSSDCDFDPGTGVAIQTATNTQSFLLMLDADGDYQWAKSWGGNGEELVQDLSLDEFDNIYVNGTYELNADFDPDTSQYYIWANGLTDMYLTKYSKNGQFLWAVGVGSTGEEVAYGSATYLGEVCFVGFFEDYVDFDPGLGADIYFATMRDCAIINVTACQAQVDSVIVDACNEYTVPSGDETYTTSGIITDTILDMYGCDSILQIDLQLNYVDNGVTLSGFTLTADLSSGSYQWINCTTQTIVAGETAQSYTPNQDGNYAVIVSDSICSDTSDCIAVSGLSLGEDQKYFAIYPNPMNDGQFRIKSDFPLKGGVIEIFELNGKLVFQQLLYNSNEYIQFDGAPGSYIIKLKTSEIVKINTLIVK